jgi:signal transduction histidine kinase
MQVQLGQVLELNQIEVGKIEPEFFEVWVSELVQGVVETFVARASQKDMTLRFEMDCPDILAMTDIMLASRVLENLVSNAVKYSPLGSVVSVFVEADGDGYAIGVREGGPGLSIDDQEKLYRPFSKLTPAPTAGEPSTGVGLSIVKSLVVLLGGTIECDSHLGEGTTFRVSLTGSPEGSSKAGSCEIWDSSELGRCA